MGRKNTSENIVVRIITYIANLIILNLLFLLFSIPVFTYGAAWSALYYMTCELKAGETVVVMGFFKAFREQFKQATKSWVILMIPGMFLLAEANLLLQVEVNIPSLIYVCAAIPLIAYFCYLPWVLIQPVYFYCTQKQQLKNAFLFVLQRFPQTVIMAALQLFPIWLFLMKTVTFIRVWPLWIFLYYSLESSVFGMLVEPSMKSLKDALREKMK